LRWCARASASRRVLGTEGHTITAILAEPEQVSLASAQGSSFSCRRQADGRFQVTRLGPDQARLLALDDEGAPLPITSLARAGASLLLGTRGRGLLSLESGVVSERTARRAQALLRHQPAG
jgi:hypothetical protein